MNTPIRLVVAGVGGRMGREVVAAAAGDGRFAIVGGVVRPGSPHEGAPFAMVTGVDVAGARIAADPRRLVPDADVVVDFSAAAGTLALAEMCAAYRVPLASGVTGFAPEEMAALRALAARTPILHARNMSPGVAAMLALLPALAEALAGYDVEIVETHHRHKQDAPSGTALALAEAAAGDAPRSFGRSGIAPRVSGEVGIHAVRTGGNPGEHTVVFAAHGEEVRVCHRAFSRRAYADGALSAAARLVGRAPGMYALADLAQRFAPSSDADTVGRARAPITERELAGA